MVFPRARLAVSAVLFLVWIGYLCYLVARTRDPVVLSRSQILVTDLVALADILENKGHPASEVRIDKVLWSREKGDHDLDGRDIALPSLAANEVEGWRGAGTYLVPLTKLKAANKEAHFQVTLLPSVPGFHGTEARIYKATADVLFQWENLAAAGNK